MIRLLGILLGAATAIGIILFITGVPEFHLEDPAINQQRYDAAVEKLKVRKREAELAAKSLADDVVQAAVSVQEDFDSATNEAMLQTETVETVAAQSSEDTDDKPAPERMEFSFVPPGDEAQSLSHMQWYSFWNPFRSKIAASGFVSRLEEVTGLDYRIVKVKTGVYEVAFAYNDDAERRSKLSQISAATGLDLPDS